jgi:hypothetical protein
MLKDFVLFFLQQWCHVKMQYMNILAHEDEDPTDVVFLLQQIVIMNLRICMQASLVLIRIMWGFICISACNILIRNATIYAYVALECIITEYKLLFFVLEIRTSDGQRYNMPCHW